MGESVLAQGPGFVGREAERQLLVRALEGAASGQPSAVVVEGEAGVGKTWLVRNVCRGFGDEIQVLWGTCVRFGSAGVPFGPVTGALQAWLTRADSGRRAEVVAGADELMPLLPSLGVIAATTEVGRMIPVIDRALDRLANHAPTVLVFDDLQWADRSSLDLLAYLIAGFRHQRLAVLATCREEHRGEGHPLHGWLADMRRMPHFAEIRLDRFGLAETEAQIAGLIGRAADIEFAAQVHDRSGGNPYLTELLVRGMSGDELVLPRSAPAALRDALLATWHSLSAPARLATRVIALAGGPIEFAVLAEVAAVHDLDAVRLADCLAEAQEGGVLQPGDGEHVWFRHPLLADVLEEAMPRSLAARIHATYVRVLETSTRDTAGRSAADLAAHCERAGRQDDAFRWSIIAADYASRLHAAAEEAVNLERACALWDKVAPGVRGSPRRRIDLLVRASQACDRVGRVEAAITWLDQAMDLVDRNREPLLASTLLCAMCDLKWQRATPGGGRPDEVTQAMQLTEQFPKTAERARALAGLASAEMWDDRLPEAAIHADEAVRIARKAGSDVVLAGALNVRASVHVHRDEMEAGIRAAEAADQLARRCGDSMQLAAAANWRVIGLQELGMTADAIEVAQETFREALRGGTPHWGYFLAALGAEGLLLAGRWDESRAVLREALSARTGSIPAAALRMVAARLAVRSGDMAAANQHFDRARELIPGDYPGLRMRMALTGAEVLSARGHPREAIEWVRTRMTGSDSDHLSVGFPNLRAVRYNDLLLLPLAAAAAELATASRDLGDSATAAWATSTLEEAIARWPHKPFTAAPESNIQSMRRALFVAELARCRGDATEASYWTAAIDSCHRAGAPWHAAASCLRRANALTIAGSPRPKIAQLLREAHRAAVELDAKPLQRDVEALARITRIDLREPTASKDQNRAARPLADLTAREREILAHLVAGRSNGEIARDLVISDKTVSVHVSNILRKTGTLTRQEAAALAERLATQDRNRQTK